MTEIFGTQSDLTWWQECAQAVLLFAYGLLLVRLAGRRVFGKWTALDIIVSIIVGSNLSRALTGSAPLVGTMVATALLMLIHWILASAAARSDRLSAIVEGRAIELARGGGPVRRDELLRHSVSGADLHEALRQAGVERASDAKLVSLEPSGKITVVKGSS
jgi:uncharacterized membrane protein YcaP (DUF421 family)